MTQFDYIQSGRRTVEIEAQAVDALRTRIDESFNRACSILLNSPGRVIVTGMGKSGHIGKKIAATLASTGTPAFFVHPGEANHGDLGMITRDDAVIAISYSGNSDEIMTLVPLIKRLGVPIISMTGKPRSPLAQEAEVNLDISVACEACPLALAPTASTTATLVMGDALAIALLEARGFTAEDFAFSHPGGTLGRKLLLRVDDIMHRGESVPRVGADTPLSDALLEMTRKGFGMTTVVDEQGGLLGVYTDGDLRRSIDLGTDLTTTLMSQLMNRHPKTVSAHTLAAEALKVMEDNKITALVVLDEQRQPHGILHMHDILRAGII
ncbi:KpsF/GutQ family sugar-phosphate isomerase [Marinimicrobium sp. C2-29]|uniref:KpsF/GutQ family sugar-phosphate isomerase n=1 Tax=Marinimicrobium sp. C2-29 TaxID=3139825 RepID=UPI003139AB3F